MQTQPISMKQLRENFSYVKAQLEDGQSFTLIYRSQPIADIVPASWNQPTEQKPIKKRFNVRKHFKSIDIQKHVKKKLTPGYMNKLLEDKNTI